MTQTNETITVKYAASNVELEAVKAIYRSSKRELGFLPDGAFQERYDRGQILIVVVDGTIAGYVLFSTNQKYEVRIAHLVIARAFQGRKLSTYLIDRLKLDFASHSRIRLNCRSDFAAAKIWQRLGFVAGSRIVGKKIGGSELIVYQFRLNDMPLFDQKPNVQEVPTIVCDANVCIDIQYTDRPRHENSCGLLADWLADEVSLAVSDEIFNDLDRQQEPMRSEMLSSIRATWEVIVADQSLVELNRDVIRSILGDPKDVAARSTRWNAMKALNRRELNSSPLALPFKLDGKMISMDTLMAWRRSREQRNAIEERSDIATKWRKVVAMGVSPWNIENKTRSPEGTKGNRAFASPFRSFGAPLVRATQSMGSRPWLHRFVPSGLGDLVPRALRR